MNGTELSNFKLQASVPMAEPYLAIVRLLLNALVSAHVKKGDDVRLEKRLRPIVEEKKRN